MWWVTFLIFNLVPVKVAYVVPEWVLGQPAVVLKDTVGDQILPIFIGPAEAQAIDFALKGIQPARPQTHDLILKILRQLHAEVQQVVVTDLEEDIYFAELHVKTPSGIVVIDARPSDAIAIALRAKAPIRVEEQVFRKYRESLQQGSGKKKSNL